MTAIDCAPVNCLSLQAGGRTGCQCSAATQLEPGLERHSALVVLGLLGGGGESPATLLWAVSRCVSARNRLGSGRKVGRRWCRRSVVAVTPSHLCLMCCLCSYLCSGCSSSTALYCLPLYRPVCSCALAACVWKLSRRCCQSERASGVLEHLDRKFARNAPCF